MNQDNGLAILLAIVIGFVSYRGFKNRTFESKYIFSTTAILVRKEYYRMISSGFLHAGWGHLFFNMYSFVGFSRILAYLFGAWFPCFVLMVGIFSGSVLSLIIHRNREYRAYGASGGVMAVIYAAIMINPNTRIGMFLMPVGVPAYVFAIGYLVYSAYSSIRRRDNVGHDAHIGGAIAGTAIALVYAPGRALSSPLLLILIGVISVIYVYVVVYGRSSYRFSGQRTPLGTRSQVSRSDNVRADRANLDKLLDKVSLVGYKNLSKAEQKRLQDLSRKMKAHNERIKQEREDYYRARD